MYIKIHKTEKQKVIAICDEELIDSVIKGKDFEIDMKDYEHFYKGQIKNKEEIKKELKDFTSINCIGNNSVRFLMEEGIVKEEHIVFIGKTMHAQVYRVV